MYKKKFLKLLIIIFSILIIYSCSIEQEPENKKDTNKVYENKSKQIDNTGDKIYWPIKTDKNEIIKEIPNEYEREESNQQQTAINNYISKENYKNLKNEITRYLEEWKEDISIYIKNWLREEWWFYFMWKLNCYYSAIITKSAISIPKSDDKTCIDKPKIIKVSVLSCKENYSKEYDEKWYEINRFTNWNKYFFY